MTNNEQTAVHTYAQHTYIDIHIYRRRERERSKDRESEIGGTLMNKSKQIY